MNKELTRTPHFVTRTLISQNAARGVFVGRRRTPSTTPIKPASTLAASPPAAREDTAAPARGQRPLRRWSVAELIARAVAAPSADPVSHG